MRSLGPLAPIGVRLPPIVPVFPIACLRVCGFIVNGASADLERYRRDLTQTRAVFNQASVSILEGPLQMIDDATLLDHPDWDCVSPEKPANTVRLFNMRGQCQALDILFYYVRSIGGNFIGCGGPTLINGRAGFVTTDAADQNTFPHELGHGIFGVGHVSDNTNIMSDSAIVVDPPRLNQEQIGILGSTPFVQDCGPTVQGPLARTVPTPVPAPLMGALLTQGSPFPQVRQLLLASRESLAPVVRMGQAVVPALVVLLGSDPDPVVRSRAAAALGMLGGMAAMQALERAARQDASPVVRLIAVNALGRLGGPAAEAVLIAALRDSDVGVRVTALRSLVPFRTAAARTAIAQLALQEPDPRVRAMALMLTMGSASQ